MEHHHPFHGGGARVGFSSLLLAVLIASSFPSPFSAAGFSPATSILLNCGSGDSASAPDVDQRTFLPDSASSNAVTLSSSSSTQVSDRHPSPGASTLYSTARIFTDQSSYTFTVTTAGTHVLRLHFSPFPAPEFDLFSAVFAVSALGSFRLLTDFSVPRGAPTPVVKEFLLWVDSGELDVTFTPVASGSSPPVAFVSAMELFTAPRELIQRDSQQLTSLPPQAALETVHRINVGGPKIVPSNDTLWRTWIPDDGYLFGGVTAMEVNTSLPVAYQKDGSGSTPEVAPERVYDTARAMNSGVLVDPRFNITWQFNVSGGGGVSHLVRMHFYDFVSKAAADLYFNAYVDGEAVYTDLHPFTFAFNSFSVPFYWDSVVGGGGGGEGAWRLMRVSVGRSAKSSPTKVNAILNGLEIMRVLKAGEVTGHKKKKTTSLLFILISSVAGVLLALLVFSSLFLFSRRRRTQRRAPEGKETTAAGRAASWSPFSMTTASKISQGTTASTRTTPRVINLGLHISFEEIRIATSDFDAGLVIGKGGFGSVYRGVLRDGTAVAVKRGVAGGPSNQGYPEFQTEVTVLSRIRHRHLVSLIGFCDENGEMILVYEFMEKGPLKNLLYGGAGEAAPPCLSWKQRLEICIGAARGIHYLHTGHAQVIIHRDLKSSNILLGEDYVAKVSDFGLSRLGPAVGETHVSTAVKGSFGYLDPEYFKTQQLTDKSDVYSFGVVLFEVLCARPVLDPLLSRDQLNLAEWAAAEHRKGRLEQIVDPRLRGAVNPNSLRKFGETAVKCLAEYGADRPSIGDVLWNLEYCLQLQETELRREPHEDSGQMPVPVAVRRMPSSNAAIRAADRDGNGGDGAGAAGVVDDEESPVVEFTTSKVFSQLITHEGR